MKNRVKIIMLVDDNADDNFIHERRIIKCDAADFVVIMDNALKALKYLKSKTPWPDLIFLDINMPGMNGWEFLVEYAKLESGLRGKRIIVMLTTSDDPVELMNAKLSPVILEFRKKPITEQMLAEILESHSKS